MMEELKSFICNEFQESITIYNFNSMNPTQRFKAQRNGIPAVLQFTTVAPHLHSQLAGSSLCPGIPESDFVKQADEDKSILDLVSKILIERAGTNILYRHRSCELLVKNSDMCSPCKNLTNPNIISKEECEEGELNFEDGMEYYDNEYESDAKVEAESATVINIVKNNSDEPEHNYQCQNCGKKFMRKRGLRDHSVRGKCDKKNSKRKKNFQCHLCGESFDNRWSLGDKDCLKKHLAEVHNMDIFTKLQCTECGAEFKKDLDLKHHMVLTHNHEIENFEKCPLCDEVFRFRGKVKQNILVHVKNYHVDQKLNPIYIEFLKERETIYPCDQCGEKFSGKRSLSRHLITTHQIQRSVSCEICGKMLTSEITLNLHMKYLHEENESICPKCGESLKNETKLKRHIQEQHGESHICADCGKCYKNTRLLYHHIRIRHLGIRLQCTMCVKEFTEKASLKSHILVVHEQLKPWFCEHCPFRCARYGNLNIHKKKMHQYKESMPCKEFIKLIKEGQHPNCSQLDIDQQTIIYLQ